MLSRRESNGSLPCLHTLEHHGLGVVLGVFVLALVSAASAQPAPLPVVPSTPVPRARAPRTARGADSLPALPNVVEDACAGPRRWHGDASVCRHGGVSARMVRVVVGSDRYAFVQMTDARSLAADGPVTYGAHLWKNGRLVVPHRLARARQEHGVWQREDPLVAILRAASPVPAFYGGDFVPLSHDYVPRLPAVDDDTAERWLRGLVLASQHGEMSPRMTREGSRRVLRDTWPGQSVGPLQSGSLRSTVVESWLDDAGAWDVQVRPDTLTASDSGGGQAPVEVRIRGSVQMGPGARTGGDEHFDDAPVVLGLRRRLSAIRACYETQLRASPRLAGRVKVEFTVDPTGPVRDVRVTENTTNLPEVGACVAVAASRLRVDPGPAVGSVTLSYPFAFSPEP